MTSIVFLHHSVGGNLIDQGGLRQTITSRGYEFFDHGYNEDGLTLATGERAGYDFGVPDDNTDPDGLHAIFAQTIDLASPLHGRPTNAISGLTRYDVIVFKSCFPANAIRSDQQLSAYKEHYLAVRSFVDAHPEQLIIALSTPPLERGATNAAEAARARAIASWLKSPEFLSGRSNLKTFDLFDQFAEPDPARPDHNMLRAPYIRGNDPQSRKFMIKQMLRPTLRLIGRGRGDSHPNSRANRIVAPRLADAIDLYVRQYLEHRAHSFSPSSTIS